MFWSWFFYVGENRGFLVAVGLCPAHTRLPTRWPVRTRRWRRACDRAVHGLECVREISRWHAGASQDSDLSRSSDWISVSTSDIPALRPTRMSAPGHPTPSRKFWLWRGLEVFLDRKRCFFRQMPEYFVSQARWWCSFWLKGRTNLLLDLACVQFLHFRHH